MEKDNDRVAVIELKYTYDNGQTHNGQRYEGFDYYTRSFEIQNPLISVDERGRIGNIIKDPPQKQNCAT